MIIIKESVESIEEEEEEFISIADDEDNKPKNLIHWLIGFIGFLAINYLCNYLCKVSPLFGGIVNIICIILILFFLINKIIDLYKSIKDIIRENREYKIKNKK